MNIFKTNLTKRIVFMALIGALCFSGCGKKAPVNNNSASKKDNVPTAAPTEEEKQSTIPGKVETKGFTREQGEGKIMLSDEVQFLDKMKSINGSEYTINLSYDNKTDGSNQIDEKSLVLTIQDKEHTYTIASGSFAFYNIEKKADAELAYLGEVNGTLVTFRYNEICDEEGNKTTTNGRFDMLLTYGSSRVADEISWYDEKLEKNHLLFDCLKLELAKPYTI